MKAFKLVFIHAKLVSKIQGLQFVDMQEILPDNIALLSHMEALNYPIAHPPLVICARLKLCEVNSLLLWVIHFSAYTVNP